MSSRLLLDVYLKQLRLNGFAQHYEALAREAESSNLGYVDYLAALCEQEVLLREQNQLQRRLKQAMFPWTTKTLDTFDFTAVPSLNKAKILNLARGDFVRERESCIIIGNPGTGKTHLAIAIGREVCHQGYRVLFVTAAGLVNELLAAQQEYRLNKLQKQLSKFDLVICDELGYIPFSQDGARLLFQFFSDRYDRKSVLITTNLDFAHWTEVFGDERMTAALLDRLTHKGHIILIEGESYRFKERLRKEKAS